MEIKIFGKKLTFFEKPPVKEDFVTKQDLLDIAEEIKTKKT